LSQVIEKQRNLGKILLKKMAARAPDQLVSGTMPSDELPS
jgi:hypothetical protein